MNRSHALNDIERAKTEKLTTRTGRAIGKKKRAKVCISVNDEDRNLSRLWELVKGYYSKRKQTAAETARRVFLRGLAAELEEITIRQDAITKEQQDNEQGRLF